MLNLFKKKPTIHAVTIPTFGWDLGVDEKHKRQWFNPKQSMALSVNYFELRPDLLETADINAFRAQHREQLVPSKGGLIQTDFLNIGHIKSLKTIFKFRQQVTGMVYLTSLTIPFKTCSYVIKIQAPEEGLTGIRESMVTDRLLKEATESAVQPDFENWSQDPYDPEYNGSTLMHISEKEEYDADFPNHPLSISRKLIAQIEAQIELDKALIKLKPFFG